MDTRLLLILAVVCVTRALDCTGPIGESTGTHNVTLVNRMTNQCLFGSSSTKMSWGECGGTTTTDPDSVWVVDYDRGLQNKQIVHRSTGLCLDRQSCLLPTSNMHLADCSRCGSIFWALPDLGKDGCICQDNCDYCIQNPTITDNDLAACEITGLIGDFIPSAPPLDIQVRELFEAQCDGNVTSFVVTRIDHNATSGPSQVDSIETSCIASNTLPVTGTLDTSSEVAVEELWTTTNTVAISSTQTVAVNADISVSATLDPSVNVMVMGSGGGGSLGSVGATGSLGFTVTTSLETTSTHTATFTHSTTTTNGQTQTIQFTVPACSVVDATLTHLSATARLTYDANVTFDSGCSTNVSGEIAITAKSVDGQVSEVDACPDGSTATCSLASDADTGGDAAPDDAPDDVAEDDNNSASISVGGQVGIAIACVFVVGAIIGACYLILRIRRKRQISEHHQQLAGGAGAVDAL